jgi:hypothetical protein
LSGPAVSIVFGLEESPQVRMDYGCEGDEIRMLDWLEGHPEYVRLISLAMELEGVQPA